MRDLEERGGAATPVFEHPVTRADLLKWSGGAALGLTLGPFLAACGGGGGEEAGGKGGTIGFADVGVGDPGDWSKFKKEAGWNVKLISIGNAPSAILTVLTSGGGAQVYDVINIVGGMQRPLVENDVIEPIDTDRLPNWKKNTYLSEFMGEGTPGFEFVSYEGKLYGVSTILQGDSFAYLPEETGRLDSYAAMFDTKWKGFVALEDNFTTTGQKTALFLKQNGLADIKDPNNMTPDEVKKTIDFLIEKKRAGQFRVIWSSFEQAVNLLVNKEVYVMDAWEPMVFAAKDEGVNAEYAVPKEGYLLWAMAAYVLKNPDRSKEKTDAIYDLLNFMLGGWYGAKITLLRGYMTNPSAITYAQTHKDEFGPEEAKRVREIHEGVEKKFELGGTWQQRWPTHVDVYEEEWARFKAAQSG